MLRRRLRRLMYRLFARQFIAGESFAEALPSVEKLLGRGFEVTLDILGESVQTMEEAQRNAQAYVHLIHQMEEADIPINVSVKLSALGLSELDPDLSTSGTLPLLREILTAATRHPDGFVRVDMEQYALKQATLGVVYGAHLIKSGHIGPVLQAMLYDTAVTDIPDAARAGMRVRLCKGAYTESASVAHQDPGAIRGSYVYCAEHLLRESAPYPAFATHDDVLIEHIKRYAEACSIPKSAFEFQMLYGVRTKLQEQLVADGYTVRIYIPFGEDWWKYFRRRLREGKKRQILFLLIRSALRI